MNDPISGLDEFDRFAWEARRKVPISAPILTRQKKHRTRRSWREDRKDLLPPTYADGNPPPTSRPRPWSCSGRPRRGPAEHPGRARRDAGISRSAVAFLGHQGKAVTGRSQPSTLTREMDCSRHWTASQASLASVSRSSGIGILQKGSFIAGRPLMPSARHRSAGLVASGPPWCRSTPPLIAACIAQNEKRGQRAHGHGFNHIEKRVAGFGLDMALNFSHRAVAVVPDRRNVFRNASGMGHLGEVDHFQKLVQPTMPGVQPNAVCLDCASELKF